MAKFDPTPQQARAIDSRAKLVVVSAGAGSGKTAVLFQRIVSRLCNDRADIDRFLVVTYTNAAALEMRERIA
jgi:ATP-dependent helicase/nuclease subunit A